MMAQTTIGLLAGKLLSEKLKVKGRSFPEVNSKFCDQVIKKIMHDVKEINLSGKKMEKFIFC